MNKAECIKAIYQFLLRELGEHLSRHENRCELLVLAGLPPELRMQVNCEVAANTFLPLLLTHLDSYGTLDDGRSALEHLLEASKSLMQAPQHAVCDRLIQEFRVALQPKEVIQEMPDGGKCVKCGASLSLFEKMHHRTKCKRCRAKERRLN